MEANAVISLKQLAAKPAPIDGRIVIGKDILDLLAGAMYVNPLDVYREYVQNAADALDQASDAALVFDGNPSVSIKFDQTSRTATIRDNGISIPMADFVSRLTAIGGSKKRGTLLRGFRGVGRLSGLGYCQELVFRGRAEGEKKICELRWDGRALREKLRDQSYQGSLTELIQSIVSFTTLSATATANYPKRFFEVELRKVSRLKNDLLLNEDLVRDYLSQVAPVPFSKQFTHGKAIDSYLRRYGIRPPIDLEVGDDSELVVRKVQSKIAVREGFSDEIKDIKFVEYLGADGDVAAVGWICDHSYYGALPKKHGIGGIRLRSGNIQVGDEAILAELFAESRFSNWAIGEIHVISKRILPNGRRDDFEPSNHYSHLQGELTILAKQIAQCIRDKSIQRNRLRALNNHLVNIQEWIGVASGEQLPNVVCSVIREIADERLKLANEEARKLIGDPEQHELALSTIAEIQSLLDKHQIKRHRGRRTETDDILSVAIKVILAGARKPSEGVTLSVRVLNAVASPTAT